MKKVFGILLAILMLVSLATAADAYVTMKTDKRIYNQGEIVQFTMYNYNSYPVEIDFKPSVLDSTGKCIWGCIWSMVYDPIIIQPGGSYSWTWDQTGENGQVDTGRYQGYLNGYYSNMFRIVLVSESDSEDSNELRRDESLPHIGYYVMTIETIMNNMISICLQGLIKIIDDINLFKSEYVQIKTMN